MQMKDEVLREDEEAEISFHIIANIKIKKSDPDYKDFVEAMKTQNGESVYSFSNFSYSS